MILSGLTKTSSTSFRTNDGYSSQQNGSRDRPPSIRIMSDESKQNTSPRQSRLDGNALSSRVDMDALFRETEIAQEYCTETFLQESRLTSSAVMQFFLHVTRWLNTQTIRDSPSVASLPKRRELVANAIRSVCELIRMRTPAAGSNKGKMTAEDISVRTWNSLFDSHGEHDPGIWVFVLKAFVLQYEIVPRDSAENLLKTYDKIVASSNTMATVGTTGTSKREQGARKSSLGGIFGSSSTPSPPPPTSPSFRCASVETVKDAIIPLLEDLPSVRHQVLASLCLLLQRDRKQRKQVASAFGPWIFLEAEAKTKLLVQCDRHGDDSHGPSSSQVRAAVELMEILVSIPETLFGMASMFGMVETSSANGGGNPSPTGDGDGEKSRLKRHGSSLMKRGTSLRLMIKRFGITSPTNSAGSGPEEKTSPTLSDEEADKMLDNLEHMVNKHHSSLRERPARSRQSLERVYGRAPPPPPPLASTMKTSPVLSPVPQRSSPNPSPPATPPPPSSPPPITANPVLNDLQEQLKRRGNSVTARPEDVLRRNNSATPKPEDALRRNNSVATQPKRVPSPPPIPAPPTGVARKTSTVQTTTPARQPPPVPSIRPSPIRSSASPSTPSEEPSWTCPRCHSTLGNRSGTPCSSCSSPREEKEFSLNSSAVSSSSNGHTPTVMHNGVRLIPIGEPSITGVKNTTPSRPAVPVTRPKVMTAAATASKQQNPITVAAQASARRRSISKEAL